jgi:hypothetical protein
MLLPACAGACVLVLALAIEKRNVRRAQEYLGDYPSNKKKQARGPRGLLNKPACSDLNFNYPVPTIVSWIPYSTQYAGRKRIQSSL